MITAVDIGEKTCAMSVAGQPAALLVQPVDRREAGALASEAALLASQGGGFAWVAFPVNDWARDLTPWPDRAVSRDPQTGLHAGETLQWVTGTLLPWLNARFGTLPCVIGGYSLAALFALWAATRCKLFAGVAAASPSVWIQGWPDYAAAHPVQARQVFLSLGDREERTRNRAMARVGDRLRAYHALLEQQLGADRAVLVWNVGGHFQDPAGRTAAAFAWNLKMLSQP